MRVSEVVMVSEAPAPWPRWSCAELIQSCGDGQGMPLPGRLRTYDASRGECRARVAFVHLLRHSSGPLDQLA